MCEKKRVQAASWATAHFALGHDTVHCIVTQGAQQARMDRQVMATIWPRPDHDTANQRPQYGQLGCDTAALRAEQATRMRANGLAVGAVSRYNQLYRDSKAAWPLRCVTIQSIVS